MDRPCANGWVFTKGNLRGGKIVQHAIMLIFHSACLKLRFFSWLSCNAHNLFSALPCLESRKLVSNLFNHLTCLFPLEQPFKVYALHDVWFDAFCFKRQDHFVYKSLVYPRSRPGAQGRPYHPTNPAGALGHQSDWRGLEFQIRFPWRKASVRIISQHYPSAHKIMD